jgi:transposase
MPVLYPHCAGLDVHKKTVVACLLLPDPQGGWRQETRSFSPMTRALLALSDWLLAAGCTHVARESTGEYGKPGFNILEAPFAVLLVNAQPIKAVPGRKTDGKEAQWIAELVPHGLLRASFSPPPIPRELRELPRHRSNFVRERASVVNRVQKVVESATIKLAAVATDVVGVSGRAILQALIAGVSNPAARAELAKGRWRHKREQLALAREGRVQAHPRFVLSELVAQMDNLEETITRFNQQIEEYGKPCAEGIELLDTLAGVGRETAEVLRAEMGADLSRFPTARHGAAWAGLAPGNRESGGKRFPSPTRKGTQALRQGLIQAAHAAAHTKDTDLAAQYRRLATRRGKKRAIVAVAHASLGIAPCLLSRHEPYRDLGGDYCDRLRPEATAKRLVRRLENLGYQITLQVPQEALASG